MASEFKEMNARDETSSSVVFQIFGPKAALVDRGVTVISPRVAPYWTRVIQNMIRQLGNILSIY